MLHRLHLRFGLGAAAVDLEREAAALVIASVGGFFLVVAAAVATEEEVDEWGTGIIGDGPPVI